MDTVSVSDLRTRVGKAATRRDDLAIRIRDRALEIEKAKTRLIEILQAALLIQTTAKETQSQLTYHVEALVQKALDAVFPGAYVFRAAFELRRNQTEVDIWLDMDGERVDPCDASGGGVVDVVCFALRVVAWSLSQTSPVLILDEPFKWVSAGLRKTCGELLREVSDKLGLQVLMVTHDPDLVDRADRIFVVEQKRRRSQVTVLEGTKA